MPTDPKVNQIQNTDSALWISNSNAPDPYSSADPNNGSKKGATHFTQLPQFCWKDKEQHDRPRQGKKRG